MISPGYLPARSCFYLGGGGEFFRDDRMIWQRGGRNLVTKTCLFDSCFGGESENPSDLGKNPSDLGSPFLPAII